MSGLPARAAVERREIFNAWIGGESQSAIGERLGLSQQRISDVCQQVLKTLTPETEKQVVRADITACLHQLQEIHLARVVAEPPPAFSKTDILRDERDEIVRDYRGQIQHTDALLRCIAQLRALLGLDEPVRMETKSEIVNYTIEGVDMEKL
ncbi:MAG: hypothetical protein ACOYEV_18915 [Candidatus Nanopelagicales bacterium]